MKIFIDSPESMFSKSQTIHVAPVYTQQPPDLSLKDLSNECTILETVQLHVVFSYTFHGTMVHILPEFQQNHPHREQARDSHHHANYELL